MPKSGSMSHVNKIYISTLKKTPRFKKKPESEGRGQCFVDAMKLAIVRKAAVAWWQGLDLEDSSFETQYHCMGTLRAKSHIMVKRHPFGVVRELGERSASSSVVLFI
ncbi:hypothetical protein AVEN_161813-1 [Araneus ventricosus]|uniref:Uncharacterized protein n=1 Tax=Araneus ventricosus TaxID=182803 RepID=A0A4Y2ERZ3_ARAVE|nr:hypothetical protein AVEN_161813-1 [Araneus ventricosus]